MYKGFLIVALCFLMQFGFAQEVELPVDFRQHNLTDYNSSLFSPVFILDRNQPESFAYWTRWQWQTIDFDPSTMFLNYSRKLNTKSAVGIGFFQHNTGTFLQTGGVANYAYVYRLDQETSFSFGINLFAFSRSLAEEPFQTNPGIILPQEEEENQFLIQFAPSIQFAMSNFRVGLVGENLYDYNFTTSERETQSSRKIILGYAGYDIPVSEDEDGQSSTHVRPMIYYKTIPGMDNQIGLSTIYSTPKYWAQGGFNSFYGLSAGAGARLLGNLSIGALAEFGLKKSLDGRDPSIELVLAYFLGPQDLRNKVVGFEVEEDEEVMVPEESIETEEEEPTAEALAMEEAREQARRDQQKLESEREAERQLQLQQEQDSIAAARQREAEAAEAQRIADEEAAKAAAEKAQRIADEQAAKAAAAEAQRIADEEAAKAAQLEKEEAAELEKEKTALQPAVERPREDEKPDPGEKYQQSTITKEGVAPGYYLIVNVFGNKNYYNRFMEDLRKRGFSPGSFLRPVNNYNYVYLERYNTVGEARAARRSRYNGRYTDDIWIFAVLPD